MKHSWGITFPTLMFIFGVLGYFVYDKTWTGFLGVVLIYFLLSLIGFLGIIPIGGLIIYWFLGKWAIAKLLVFTGLTQTWLITLTFWTHAILALIITVISISLLLGFFGITSFIGFRNYSFHRKIIKACKATFSNKSDVKKCVERRSYV